nr:chorismate mutase [uncultured Fluviicola sp.]
MKLGTLRIELEKLDAELIRLLSERQRIACDIGTIKQCTGIPFEQPEIWKQQCLKRREWALALGVNPHLVSEVFESIHHFSLDIQKQHTTKHE